MKGASLDQIARKCTETCINPKVWFCEVDVKSIKTPTQRAPTPSALRAGLSEFCPTSVVAGTTEIKLRIWQGGSIASRARETRSGEEAGPAWDVSAHESYIGRISAFGWGRFGVEPTNWPITLGV